MKFDGHGPFGTVPRERGSPDFVQQSRQMVYLNGKRSRISGGNKSSSFVLHTMPARAFTDVEIRARLVNKPILNSKPAAMTPVIHYYYPDV